ncbi:hypothetical protein SUGI_0215880 [Cryptomeria japonica]|nr:hypothetical protein SUGI_0215880 [Cryptomeria japonica]
MYDSFSALKEFPCGGGSSHDQTDNGRRRIYFLDNPFLQSTICSLIPMRDKKNWAFTTMQKLQRRRTSHASCLCDLSQERYEVREKKNTKMRPNGLKAMGSMDSDSN